MYNRFQLYQKTIAVQNINLDSSRRYDPIPINSKSSYSVYPLISKRGLTWRRQSAQDAEKTKRFDVHLMDFRLSDNQDRDPQLNRRHRQLRIWENTVDSFVSVFFEGIKTWSHREPSPPPIVSPKYASQLVAALMNLITAPSHHIWGRRHEVIRSSRRRSPTVPRQFPLSKNATAWGINSSHSVPVTLNIKICYEAHMYIVITRLDADQTCSATA